MMGNRIEYRIDELCEVGRGSSPRPIMDERFFIEGNIPWVKIADATISGKYIYQTKEHVNEFGASFSRYLEPNSLIIAASGVSLGQIKFLGIKGCIHDGWIYISSYKTNLLEKEYLYYFLIYYSKTFHNFSYGAAIQNINTDIIRNTKIPLPPLSIQREIVSILNTYDNLLEINKQQIKLLEEMAGEIYKEWFVRLRFPGYETIRYFNHAGKEVSNDTHGAIPEGWSYSALSNHLKIFRGKSYSSEELRDNEGRPMLNLKNINRGGGFRRDGLKYFEGKFAKHHLTYSGDIILAITDMTQNREIVGRVAIIPEMGIKEFIISMDLIKIVPIHLPKIFLYSFFRYSGIGLKLAEFANGANVLHLTPDLIYLEKAKLPNLELAMKFEEFSKPIINEIDVLENKNRLLQQTRDLLLPRLISGKLSVEHLSANVD